MFAKQPPKLRLSSGMISLCALLIQAAGWSHVNPIPNPAATECVWETMRERGRAWRVCPEAGNIRLSALVRMVPSAHQCSHPFLV